MTPGISKLFVVEHREVLRKARGQATRDLHRHLASAALGAMASEVNAEREARETQCSRLRANPSARSGHCDAQRAVTSTSTPTGCNDGRNDLARRAALWLLSAVPLVRLSSDEGGGAGVAAAYLAAGLGVALVSRGIYKLLRGRPFWSPWLFVIAAVLAITSYAIQSAGERAAIESRAVPVSTL